MGTCNRQIKFGLKIPNRLEKVSGKFRGDLLTHTVGLHRHILAGNVNFYQSCNMVRIVQ